MIKKMMTAMMILVAAACCFAATHTHTIYLISTVEKLDAQYVLRNNETGKIGASVHYITEEIAKQDVRTSFDIVQSCNSNGYNNVRLTVEATELVARVNGKTYSTQGVSIIRDGINYGSTMSFTQTTYGPVAAGAVAASFEVLWNTDSSLVQASYEACVTLTATAL